MSLTKILSRGLGTGVGGKVLQVVSTTKTDTFTGNGTAIDVTGLSVTITPSSTSNKILLASNPRITGLPPPCCDFCTNKNPEFANMSAVV